jgi:hypothetical protein
VLTLLIAIWNSGDGSRLAKHGAVAQLGERLNGIQKVVGSIPISSIFLKKPQIFGVSGLSLLVSFRLSYRRLEYHQRFGSYLDGFAWYW